MIDALKTATAHMQTALDLLDIVKAPPELGAHLATTICLTTQVIEQIEARASERRGPLPADTDSPGETEKLNN